MAKIRKVAIWNVLITEKMQKEEEERLKQMARHVKNDNDDDYKNKEEEDMQNRLNIWKEKVK